MSKKSDDLLFDGTKKEDNPIRKLCVRFNGDSKEQRNFKDAVAYLFLRQEGCPRKDAILFTAKNNCRVDTTKDKDGPNKFRALKILPIPHYMIEEGWLYGQHDFQLGKCFPSRYSKSYAETVDDQKMEENFNGQEIKMRKEYKEMIKRMKEYVKQINSKYEISGFRGEKLVEAIKQIVAGMKKELDSRQFILLNNIRFYDIAEVIASKTQLTEEESNNLIEKLNVFSNFENEPEFVQQPIFKIEDEETNTNLQLVEKQQLNSSITAYQKQEDKSNKQDQKPNADAARQSQIGNVDKSIQFASQLKQLESATKLLEEFERSEGEDISKPTSKFDRSYATEKKMRQEQMKSNLEMVREENQAALEGQFNQQKYYFATEEKQGTNLQREQREKEELQNYIFNTYCKTIDDQFFENFQNMRKQLKTEGKNQNSSPLKINTNFNLPSSPMYSINIIDSTTNIQRVQTQPNTSQSSIGDLNMDAILNLKNKELKCYNNFRQKVQTCNISKRQKMLQSQKEQRKYTYYQQNNQQDPTTQQSEIYIQEPLHEEANDSQLPHLTSQQSISSSHQKMQLPSLREIRNISQFSLKANNTPQYSSSALQKLSSLSSNIKNSNHQKSKQEERSYKQYPQTTQSTTHSLHLTQSSNNLPGSRIRSKHNLSIGQFPQDMQGGRNPNRTFNNFKINPNLNQMLPNLLETPLNPYIANSPSSTQNSKKVKQLLSPSQIMSTTPSTQSKITSVYFFPQNKQTSGKLPINQQRPQARTTHTTTIHSEADSITSKNQPFFYIPKKKQ